MRRSLEIVSFVLAAALVPGAVIAQRTGGSKELSQESAEAAIEALRASLDVERDVLKSQLELYRKASTDRDAASRRLAELLNDFDALVQSDEPAPADQLSVKEKEIADTERQRASAIERGRELRGRIQEIQDRISGLEKKVTSLRDALPKTRETLTGSWQVIYLPGVNKGVFVLRQTGTIVQGQYQLDGGYRGSLQGTFIDGKIYLQRIDSKLGRSSELQGYLSSDGRSIRGTWQNYNLTDGGASAGSWAATRQED